MPSEDEHPDPALPTGTVRGYFTTREKLGRAAWYLIAATLFRCSLRRADGWRAFLLRRFGARVGKRCLIRRTAWIEVPWNVSIGDDVMIGEHAIVYSLGRITIGDRAIISQYAHLCGGSHDIRTRDMVLLRIPITIGADTWIAADAFVGPGVTIGEGTIIGARSSVFRDLPAWMVCVGSPAKPIRQRKLDEHAPRI